MEKPDRNALKSRELEIYKKRISGTLADEGRHFRLIDLFAGAGGMTLGFGKAFNHVFQSIWANDFNDYCVETYNANFGDHCLGGDIVDILENPDTVIPEADVVIGGPPCQGFSLLNKNREGDPRKQLWRPYFEVLKRSKARVFVMENVPQLLDSYEYKQIKGVAKETGFEVWGKVLTASDYGVPQTRKRAIIIGSKIMDPKLLLPPLKTHYSPKEEPPVPSFIGGIFNGHMHDARPWRNVRDAISDLPAPEGTEIRDVDPPFDLHFGRNPTEKSIARYKTVSEEGMNRFDLQRLAPELTPACWIRKKSGGTDLFGRLWWDRPSFTIRTEFYKPEKGRYLHPQQHRPITHREAARLQSFPDDFIFKGTKIEIARQIGNAVPPLLAAKTADIVYLLLTLND